MSRGLGETQRGVLAALAALRPPSAPSTWLTVRQVLEHGWPEDAPTKSRLETVRQSVHRLVEAGLVEVDDLGRARLTHGGGAR